MDGTSILRPWCRSLDQKLRGFSCPAAAVHWAGMPGRAAIEPDLRVPDVGAALALAARDSADELVMHADAGALDDWADNFAAGLAAPAAAAAGAHNAPLTAASHISDKHPGVSERALANCALGRCPADGCGRVFSLLPTGANPRSGLQQHLVSKAKEVEHARAASAGGGIAKLDTRCLRPIHGDTRRIHG